MFYVWMDEGIKFHSGLIQKIYVDLKNVKLNINAHLVGFA